MVQFGPVREDTEFKYLAIFSISNGLFTFPDWGRGSELDLLYCAKFAQNKCSHILKLSIVHRCLHYDWCDIQIDLFH